VLISAQAVLAQTSATPPFYNNNGTGSDNTFPLSSTTTNKVQWVYGPNVFKTAGTTGTLVKKGKITKVYFMIGATASASAVYTDFTLKLGQTIGTQTTWTNANFQTNLTTVYYKQTFTITGASAGAWIMVPLQTPILYDPAKSLVFEMSVSSGTGNYVRQITTGGNQRIWGAYGSNTGQSYGTGLVNFGIESTALSANDAAALTSTVTPTSSFCAGTKNLTVDVENQGSNQISSLTINWSKNGVTQTPVTYSGTLDTVGGPGSRTATITLGSQTFTAGQTVNVKAWVSSPNGSTDPVKTNDSAIKAVAPALSGTYTVGGTTPDFANVAAAASYLNNYGVCGPVTFDIRAGTYTGQISLKSITGASATNTITFKGASKTTTTITYSTAGTIDYSTVLLDGTDYVTFKDLSIVQSNSSTGWAVHFTYGADYNTFDNCNINGSATATGTTSAALVFSGTYSSATTTGPVPPGNYNVIKNSTISGGYYGVAMYGQGVSTGQFNMGNQFINNTITNFYQYGLYTVYGGEFKFIGNKINTTRSTSPYGMYFYYQSNYQILANDINVGYYCIYAYYGNYYNYNASGTKTVVANNLINSTSLYGLYYYYAQYAYFHHNTIRSTSTYTMFFGNPLNLDVRNNILVNAGTSTSSYVFYVTGTPSFTALDNNLYYGPSLAKPYYWNGISYATLEAWKSAVPQYNTTSVVQDPKFISTNDIHVQKNVMLPYGNDLGYDTDVDGDTRCKLMPTVGADESSFGKTSKPVATITGDDTVFVNSPVEFLGNQTAGVAHRNYWYVNNIFVKDSVNLLATIPSTGTFTLKLVTLNCSQKDSITKTVVVVNPTTVPDPDFLASANQVRPGDKVTFTDLSSGGATSWKWEITPKTTFDANGNPIDRFAYTSGSVLTRTNTVRFDYPGFYKVCLTAYNSIGSATTCKTAYINVLTAYNLGLTTTFAGDANGYIYDIGGPNGDYVISQRTSMLVAPCAEEVYLVFKSFKLECGYDFIKIYDGGNNAGKPLHKCTTNINLTYGPGLTGTTGSTCATLCAPKTDTFTAKSGKMYIEMNTDPSLTYPGFEAYWWSKPKKVDRPKASFSFPSKICADIPVNFTNTSTGESMSYYWDLDDDLSTIETSSKNASYMYFTAGKYTISLIVVNCGGVDTFQQEITVIKPNTPSVAFSANNTNPTTSDIVKFSPDIAECVSDYKWRFTGPGTAKFVNGTSATSSNPQVTFSATGCYNVFLYVKNSGGSDSLELNCFITVKTPYCVPTVTNNVADIGISEVTILNRDKDVVMSNTSTPGTDDYQNFTPTVSATLETGVTYDLIVKRSTNLNEVTRTVWIDWNLDADFDDAGEKIAEQKKSSSLEWTTKIIVPVTAKIGASVMRIAIIQGNLNNNVCGPNKYGEFEDYRIYITPDLTKPEITLLGDDTVYVEQGYSYTDAGATAADNLDGNITTNLKKTQQPLFDNMIPGTYLFYFDVQDKAGNQAERVTRVVIVTPDKTAPELIVSGTDTIHVDLNEPNYSDPLAVFAEDKVDGDLLDQVVTAGAVDLNKVGLYTLTYTVADQAGNTAKVTRIVIVGDPIAPVITLLGSNPTNHEVNSKYIDEGVSLSDNYCDSASLASALLVTNNVDETQPGTYTVVYNVTDCNGNKAMPVTRTVIVADNKAPEVSLNGKDSIMTEVLKMYEDPGVKASDNYGTPTVSTGGSFYTEFSNNTPNKLGWYTIEYTVTDMYNNTTVVTRHIKVVDTEAPTIRLKSLPNVTVCRWSSYTDASYELSDNFNTAGEIKISTEGNFVNTMEEGLYSLRYRAEDASGNVAYTDWRYIQVENCASGIAPAAGDLANQVAVFPNPTNGVFNVSLKLDAPEQVNITVVNTLGQEVTRIAEDNMSANIFSVNLSDQAAGVYMLHITAGNQSATKRIVITR
jgi:PKD repeat protein